MMIARWNRLTKFAAIGACCSLAVWIGSINANEETSVLLTTPVASADAPAALPPPANPNEKAKVPSPSNRTPAADPFAPSPALPPAAKQPTNGATKQPFMRPAVPRNPGRGSLTAGPETMPPPGNQPIPGDQVLPPSDTSGIHVQPTPQIEYDTDHDARKMYRSGQIDLAMLTQNPADGCYYEIPLCIPACCVGEPTISGGRSLLGRGVVEYCWPCGFRAIVKFRQLLGDVRVDYEGD